MQRGAERCREGAGTVYRERGSTCLTSPYRAFFCFFLMFVIWGSAVAAVVVAVLGAIVAVVVVVAACL